MNQDAPINPRDFSESIQELREEIRNDVRKLGLTIERRPQPKPGVSPMGVFASVVGALCVGAAGMSIYDSSKVPDETSQPAANNIADLQTVMKPHTEQLVSTAADFTAGQQKASEELTAHRLLLDRLAARIDSLQESVATQDVALHEHVDQVAEKIVASLALHTTDTTEPTTAAKPPLAERAESPVQPATAEAEIAESSVSDSEPAAAPVVPIIRDSENEPTERSVLKTTQPQRGELIIDNPSGYDLKLLVNGQPLDIKARGVSTIAVTVGTVKIQSAAAPEYAKTWDNWESVEGVQRLTVNVEAGDGYYNLR